MNNINTIVENYIRDHLSPKDEEKKEIKEKYSELSKDP